MVHRQLSRAIVLLPPQVINISPVFPPHQASLYHSNTSTILGIKYHEVIRLFQFISTEPPGKMLNSSSAALSSIINNSPLQPRTLVRLLRFRKLASGALKLEVCQDFGYEIVDYIKGKKLPSNVSNEENDDSAEDTADLPYIEILWVL